MKSEKLKIGSLSPYFSQAAASGVSNRIASLRRAGLRLAQASPDFDAQQILNFSFLILN